MQVCVHTHDKKYTSKPAFENQFSSISVHGGMIEKLKSNPNALGGQIWDDSEIVYWKLDSKYKFLTEKQQVDILKSAFIGASLETPLVIRRKNRDSADAQIIINYLGAKDETFFNDNPNALAFGWGPGPQVGGNITMNADRLWLLRKDPLTAKEAFDLGYIDDYDRNYPDNHIAYYDPVHTLKHEGGHAIGMNHLTDINLSHTAVMFPIYNGLRKFGPADLDYLHSLYGNSNINHKIKEMLIQRVLGL